MINRASEIASSMHDSVVRAFADRWTRWRGRRELQDFVRTYPDEAGRISRDLHMKTAGLVEVVSRSSGAADLLESRAKYCFIDLGELSAKHADIAQDLTRCCTLCRSKARCSRDLRLQPESQVWRTYCPNFETFTAVSPDRAAGL